MASILRATGHEFYALFFIILKSVGADNNLINLNSSTVTKGSVVCLCLLI